MSNSGLYRAASGQDLTGEVLETDQVDPLACTRCLRAIAGLPGVR
jgi:hypothetical protein